MYLGIFVVARQSTDSSLTVDGDSALTVLAWVNIYFLPDGRSTLRLSVIEKNLLVPPLVFILVLISLWVYRVIIYIKIFIPFLWHTHLRFVILYSRGWRYIYWRQCWWDENIDILRLESTPASLGGAPSHGLILHSLWIKEVLLFLLLRHNVQNLLQQLDLGLLFLRFIQR